MNDDGWQSAGIAALAGALAPEGEVVLVAPAANQSAVARSITLGTSVVVDEVAVPGAVRAFAVHGTPVDCVRFALSGEAGPPPDVVVAGANHGLNVGDDVTYSVTVAAALEGLLLGLPAIAFSQQSLAAELEHPRGDASFDFAVAARVAPALVRATARHGARDGLVLNVNCPTRTSGGAVLARLAKRVYRSELELAGQDGARRTYRRRGRGVERPDLAGTDVEAIAAGRVAVTPLHYALDLPHGRDALAGVALDALR